jgi:uncharacterized protein (DUF1697 family)
MMPLHVAFLRGVGGPRPVPADELRKCLGAAGYDRITPVIASGNVIFGLGRKRKPPGEAEISALLEKHFGFPTPTILRSGAEVAHLVARDPFRRVDRDRLTPFIAMLAEKAPPVDELPGPVKDEGYAIVEKRGRDIFLVIDRALTKTPDVMAVLDKTFRKGVTTRNWNTIEKVAALLDDPDAPGRR